MEAKAFKPKLAGLVPGGNHQGGSPVIHAAGVARRYRTSGAEHGFQFGQFLQSGLRPRMFVLFKKKDLPLGLGHGNRHDLFFEQPELQGLARLLLALQGEGVLIGPADLIFFRHIFRCFTHRVAADGIEQDQLVHELPVAQPVAPTGFGQEIAGVAHVFQTSGHQDLRVAGLDGLGGQKDRFQGTAAGLGHGEIRHRDGDTRVHGYGSGHIGRQFSGSILLGENDLLHLTRLQAGPFHSGFNHQGPEGPVGDALQASSKPPYRRSHGTYDHRFIHSIFPFFS